MLSVRHLRFRLYAVTWSCSTGHSNKQEHVLEDSILMDTKEVVLHINTNMLWISSRMSKALNLLFTCSSSASY
jgi:hypothetical protein